MGSCEAATTGLREDVAAMKANLVSMKETLDGIHNAIHGNGQKGLKAQVEAHTVWLRVIAAAVLGAAGAAGSAVAFL